MTELLTAASLPAYLCRTGLTSDLDVEVVALAGGVSNTVLGVHSTAGAWVVKQSLPALRVEAEWLATQERTVTEGAALRLARLVTPNAVPNVVFVDRNEFVLVIDWVEGDYRPWKELLLSAQPQPKTGEILGEFLAQWHTAFADDEDALAQVDAPEAFEQLRVDPFYRTVALRLPETAAAISHLIADMAVRAITFVHGDFSPKNILVEPGRPDLPVVIDFEVAHRGDPSFDVAFLLAHLVMKAVHRPRERESLLTVATAFVDAYAAGIDGAGGGVVTLKSSAATGLTGITGPEDRTHLLRHLGALLLSRTDGKSPADYLNQSEQEAVRAHGYRLLLNPADTDPFDPPNRRS